MLPLAGLLLVCGAVYGGVVPVPAAITAAVSSQYHAQNELGEYAYGYAGGPSAKEEIKTADGITRGGYSYIDAHGLVQSASYVSDDVNGFRVAATNLPVGPAVPTGDVIAETVPVAPAVAVAPAPAVVAPAPVAVAPAPVAVAPAPVAVAPAPVAVAPAPVAVAPAPVAVAPAPVAVAPAPAAPAPVYDPALFDYGSPADLAPISPSEAALDDDSTVIDSADFALARSGDVRPIPAPLYVDDTLAVANARAAHIAAIEQTRARDALQASIDAAELAASGPVYAPAPVVEHAPAAAPAIYRSAPVAAPAQVVAHAPVHDVAHAPAHVVAHAPAHVVAHAPAQVVAHAPAHAVAHAPAQVVAHSPVHAVAHAPVHAVAHAPVAVGVTASQYHAQNELGEYSYGYAGGPSAKDEIKTADGITRGGYSYLDAHGLVQSASYVSDPHNGFRVAATNLPVQPGPVYLADTPEVAHAKAHLFQAQAEHIAKL